MIKIEIKQEQLNFQKLCWNTKDDIKQTSVNRGDEVYLYKLKPTIGRLGQLNVELFLDTKKGYNSTRLQEFESVLEAENYAQKHHENLVFEEFVKHLKKPLNNY